eukprot:CAMPEP_0172322012 /NCGR_PEP_ID=MMETSP1058-20130122/44795_1 /TAXON_ID=83371 /ORGANISM="Detonula confervacea, Strain CCMP 353" /LENGTH=73 /DNA_ID=CAMNT_0013037643 /DNA_START=139 /DNA_END=357 /DNA_ORIENTATION=+
MTKPYYISSTFSEYGECCRKTPSPDVAQCLEATPEELGGYNPSEIPDTIIEIYMYGSVSLQLLTIPPHNTEDW